MSEPRGRNRHADVEERFDQELRRAARALATADIPRDVLDPGTGDGVRTSGAAGPVRAGRPLPGLAAIAAAIVVLLLSIGLALAPGVGGPGAQPSATPAKTPLASGATVFRTTAEIRADLVTLGYGCTVGLPLASIAPVPDAMAREAAVCTPPAASASFLSAVIVGESAGGRVVEIHAKADIVGADTPAARAAIAAAIAKAAAVGVVNGSGTAVAAWVEANLPTLERGQDASTEVVGVTLALDRNATGGYFLVMRQAGAG